MKYMYTVNPIAAKKGKTLSMSLEESIYIHKLLLLEMTKYKTIMIKEYRFVNYALITELEKRLIYLKLKGFKVCIQQEHQFTPRMRIYINDIYDMTELYRQEILSKEDIDLFYKVVESVANKYYNDQSYIYNYKQFFLVEDEANECKKFMNKKTNYIFNVLPAGGYDMCGFHDTIMNNLIKTSTK